MKKYTHLLSAILLTALAACSSTDKTEANWVPVFQDPKGFDFYLDTNSIQIDLSNSHWRRVILASDVNPQTPGVRGTSSWLDMTLDCQAKTARINEMRLYEKPWHQGKIIDTAGAEEEFTPIGSDENGMRLFYAVCR